MITPSLEMEQTESETVNSRLSLTEGLGTWAPGSSAKAGLGLAGLWVPEGASTCGADLCPHFHESRKMAS